MLEQPDSPSASHAKQQVFDHYLYRLQSEIHTIISSESDYEERLKSLETDLAVFKRACFAAENDKRLLNEKVSALREKLEALEAQKSTATERRIVCLIDGDGTIFSTELMSKGQEGGRLAAKQLCESVHFHLTSSQPCHLWTYVFVNKRGLLDTLAAAGGKYKEARDRFEDFVLGFNRSSERFVMADVGNDEEGANAKIKAHLDFYARSEDTYKIVFGGCHDDSYTPQLHSLQLTSVYREKLVLLPGCTEMAPEVNKLQLPSLVIPGLFIADKVSVATHSRQSSHSSSCEPTVEGGPVNFGSLSGLLLPSTSPSEGQNIEPSNGSLTPPPPPPYPLQTESIHNVITDIVQIKPENPRTVVISPSHSSTPDRQQRVILGHASGPVSYHPLAQAWPRDQFQLAVDPHGEFGMGVGNSTNNTVEGAGKQKRIDHNIPLSQHDPPPCTLFYLASNGCKHGPDCRFGHDYILDDDDYEVMRLNAKKVPCPAANRGGPCIFGDNCCYGHTCPYLSRCHYFKQGKCKFAGANMHRETETR